jgi:maltooligosyltrehalose trehalohydrolase
MFTVNAHPAETKLRRLPIGTEILPSGMVSFRVWAPKRTKVSVVCNDGSQIELNAEAGGYFSGISDRVKAGDLYRFRLNDSDALLPDPATRFQPEGVHGPSQIVDPVHFRWTDSQWKGITAKGQVLCEMHIGTFTPEGTWVAAAGKLNELKEVGITCLEVMPVAEFPGEFGWGYDGVDLFAPTRAYGSPDDFRSFVNQAHALGISVILDVVYNHLGPDGNYLKEFSDHYFTTKHRNDWGESLNFDDTGSAGVREFYAANARHWISEYHLDGFRFDATQAILDDSKEHILAEICIAAREAAGDRSIYLITENEPQQTRIVRPVSRGGYGLDALWNDDFHHSAMAALTGRSEAYFTDYLGSPQEFISAVKWGYLFQGQFSAWQMKQRGTPAFDLAPTAFVTYIQNHDQIANFGHGERAHQLCGLAQFRAMTALLLLAPQTPLLFQGQEFAASSPFLYFADHAGEIPELIRKGRLKELSQFPSNAHPEMRAIMRDPSDRKTFERCKLDWSQHSKGWHAQVFQLHKELLALRRDDPVFNRQNGRSQMDGAVLGPSAFALRYFGEEGDRLVLVNFGSDLHMRVLPEPLLAAPPEMRWEIMLATESPRFGGTGVAPVNVNGQDWRMPGVNLELPGKCALILKPVPLTHEEIEQRDRLKQARETERQRGLGDS